MQKLILTLALTCVITGTAGAGELGCRTFPFDEPAKAIQAALRNPTATAKSQFETDEEYSLRIKPLIKVLSPARIGRLLYPQDGTYDANTEVYTISPYAIARRFERLDEMFISLSDGNYWFGAPITKATTKPSSYRARNAFGATTTVRKSSHIKVEYIVRGARHLTQPAEPIVIPMPRKEAKRTIDNLGIVIEGEVIAPYFLTDSHDISPTLAYPVDATIRLIGVPVRPTCGAIIDVVTKKVLATFDPAVLSPL
jgi:hypothetical protein